MDQGGLDQRAATPAAAGSRGDVDAADVQPAARRVAVRQHRVPFREAGDESVMRTDVLDRCHGRAPCSTISMRTGMGQRRRGRQGPLAYPSAMLQCSNWVVSIAVEDGSELPRPVAAKEVE